MPQADIFERGNHVGTHQARKAADCSHTTGLRLCGIAELPRCSPPNGSSASRTSVRCKWRISMAIFSSVAAISASVLRVMRVAIALNHLRSHRRNI